MITPKKIKFIAIALITSVVGGCSLFQGDGDDKTATPENPPETAQTAPPNPNPTPPFSKPTKPSVSPLAILTPATDPDARVRLVPKGSSNPFILVPKPDKIAVNPEIKLEELKTANNAPVGGSNTVSAVSSVPNVPTPPSLSNSSNPNIKKPSLAANLTKNPLSNNTNNNSNNSNLPSNIPTIPPLVFKPQLPALPEPSLARAVQVTGMITIGSQTKIILQAPNEPFSRYVQVGEYISDGQVLVKRIEGQQRGTPVVVLEQFGIEVVKRVENPSSTTNAETPPVPPQV